MQAAHRARDRDGCHRAANDAIVVAPVGDLAQGRVVDRQVAVEVGPVVVFGCVGGEEGSVVGHGVKRCRQTMKVHS